MTNPELDNLLKDSILAIMLSLITLVAFLLLGDITVIFKNIEVFNSTITTLLGLLFAILAILYTFESQFQESRAIQILKSNDQFIDVIRIFHYTVGVIGLVWIYTFSLTIFDFHSGMGKKAQAVFGFTMIFGFYVVIVRLIRCYWIFILLNRAIRRNE